MRACLPSDLRDKAVKYGYFTYRDNGKGVRGLMTYFFDRDGKELGFIAKGTDTFMRASRNWGKDALNRLTTHPINNQNK